MKELKITKNTEEEDIANLDSLFDSVPSNNIDYWISPEKLEIIKIHS